MRKKILTLPLLIALGLGAGPLGAVGLGQIEVQSRLNQPLVAEIPLLQVAPSELDRMHVRLASPEAFARVGLERPLSLAANLQFEITTNARGESVIRVTTAGRVDDPYLSFLLELDWGAGRAVREYNVLLDPPYLAPAARAQVAPATVAPQTGARVSPPAGSPAPTPAPAAPRQVPASPPPAAVPAPAVAAGGSVTVRAGQTLSGIASANRDPDVSLNQMMIALLRANPDAFIDGNINLLREGAVLRMPPRDEVLALRAAEANAIVSEQIAAWESRRAPVPQPAETPTRRDTTPGVATEPEARLAIVPPAGEGPAQGAQSGATQGGEGTQLRVELSQAQEELAAREAELEELSARLAELENLSQSQSRMIELRNQEFEALQRQLGEARQAPAATPAADAATPRPATPWYRQAWTLGGVALLVVGLLAWLFSRRREEPVAPVRPGRSGVLAASIAERRDQAGPASEDESGDDFAQHLDVPASDPVGEDGQQDVPRFDASWERHADEDVTAEPEASQPSHRADVGFDPASVADADQEWMAEAEASEAGRMADEDDFLVADERSDEDAGSRHPGAFTTGSAPASAASRAGDEPAASTPEEWDLGAEEDSSRAGGDAGQVPPSDGPEAADADGRDDEELDAVATKIELARAYLDIGDAEGARSMLEEVLQEGTPGQREQARSLLAGLS